MSWVFGRVKYADTILNRRAADLVKKLDIAKHLQRDGLYVDIGAGTGHISVQMARAAYGLGARVIGVEPIMKPAKRAVARAKHRTDVPVHFVKGIGNRLPLPDHTADGVSIFFVLHHIPYDIQLAVVREITRVLKPGGLLFIWEDTPENEREYAATEVRDRRLNFESRSEPHYYRSGDQWLTVFAEHGVEMISRSYFESCPATPSRAAVRHTGFVMRRQTNNPAGI